jgi:hypothetical protein
MDPLDAGRCEDGHRKHLSPLGWIGKIAIRFNERALDHTDTVARSTPTDSRLNASSHVGCSLVYEMRQSRAGAYPDGTLNVLSKCTQCLPANTETT